MGERQTRGEWRHSSRPLENRQDGSRDRRSAGARQERFQSPPVPMVERLKAKGPLSALRAHRPRPSPDALSVPRQAKLDGCRFGHTVGLQEQRRPQSGPRNVGRTAQSRVAVDVLVEEDVDGNSRSRATIGHGGRIVATRAQNPEVSGTATPVSVLPPGAMRPEPRRIVVVDNYDSFTYNLVQYIESLGAVCDVRLNDRTTAEAVAASDPAGILLSPGPGTPDDAGITLAVIEQLRGRVPILGVCLGHQSIGQAFGGHVVRAPRLMHGKTSLIDHDGKTVYAGLPCPFEATRYHSLIIDEQSLPSCLEITARTQEGELMGVRHRELPIEGVQFHPESILTKHGMQLLRNWLESL